MTGEPTIHGLGAILATGAEVTVWLSGSGVVHVTITDSIDSVDLIGSPAAVVAVCCRIINATEDALAKARVEGPAT